MRFAAVFANTTIYKDVDLDVQPRNAFTILCLDPPHSTISRWKIVDRRNTLIDVLLAFLAYVARAQFTRSALL